MYTDAQIAKDHEKCSLKNNCSLSTTEGAGATISSNGDQVDNETTDLSFVMPKSFHDTQENVDKSANHFDKEVVVEKAAQVNTTDQKKSPASLDILHHIKDKFKLEATKLLEQLADHPKYFSFDANGVVSINDTIYPGNRNLIKVNIYNGKGPMI